MDIDVFARRYRFERPRRCWICDEKLKKNQNVGGGVTFVLDPLKRKRAVHNLCKDRYLGIKIEKGCFILVLR